MRNLFLMSSIIVLQASILDGKNRLSVCYKLATENLRKEKRFMHLHLKDDLGMDCKLLEEEALTSHFSDTQLMHMTWRHKLDHE